MASILQSTFVSTAAYRPMSYEVCKNIRLKLHQLLDESEIMDLQVLFDAEEGKKMKKTQLLDALVDVACIKYDQNTFNVVYQQMDSDCDGYVTWNEFISYLILGFQEQEIGLEYKTLDDPIPSSPMMMKSNHRHRVNRIAFYPTVKLDRTCNWHDGSIVTCSPDGVVNYWSLDMQIERSAQSVSPLLKVQPTWVTDMAVMPDVSVICTSSTERDLRFYDTSARKFELRIMITSLPDAVTTMYYKFYTDINVSSKLVMGDMGGSVRIISFNSEARGPFKSQPGIPLLHVRYESALKRSIPNMKIKEFPHLHSDYVRQVSYYRALHCVVSCAQCPKALLMTDATEAKEKNYVYKIVAGAWCFAIDEGAHIVATGGPDCLVRIWNPFVPRRATCTFYGHHTGIVQMVFQDNGKRLYSLSKDKCIKVWDVSMQSLLQTYLELPTQLGDTSEITTLYNPESRQWIVGSSMIAVLSLSPNPSSEHTDGNTHISGVSVVLYNKLYKELILIFQKVVTCGLDSFVIVWNPFDGRRLLIIREAHTVLMHGAIKPVEITAATFDPGYQRLLTGAHDGTLKIWSFNSGTCLRNMRTDKWSEIKSVIWVNNRIMATGWNRRITEFTDTGGGCRSRRSL
ncbi:hypothetical protein NQ315_013046 [Exocentrus adspersus]|uniref:WD repeat-containing protein on Y chromosome n=1 Tax=Exocentrus adspersus TaxID=1586481 RepID=A0AAV8VVX1_9CUCU|nr:hypothetical protein NQ315_013046 [Exocentrus adspersus]